MGEEKKNTKSNEDDIRIPIIDKGNKPFKELLKIIKDNIIGKIPANSPNKSEEDCKIPTEENDIKPNEDKKDYASGSKTER